MSEVGLREGLLEPQGGPVFSDGLVQLSFIDEAVA
jgi:hypothetical protein